MSLKSLAQILKALAPICWGISGAIALNAIITLEWTTAACNQQQDGPVAAAFGFPLPYLQWGGVSSLEYTLMPSAYLINLLLLAGLGTYSSYHLHKKLNHHPCFATTLACIAVIAHASPSAWRASEPPTSTPRQPPARRPALQRLSACGH